MYRFKSLRQCISIVDDVIADCVLTDNVHYPIFVLLKIVRSFLEITADYFEEKGL